MLPPCSQSARINTPPDIRVTNLTPLSEHQIQTSHAAGQRSFQHHEPRRRTCWPAPRLAFESLPTVMVIETQLILITRASGIRVPRIFTFHALRTTTSRITRAMATGSRLRTRVPRMIGTGPFGRMCPMYVSPPGVGLENHVGY